MCHLTNRIMFVITHSEGIHYMQLPVNEGCLRNMISIYYAKQSFHIKINVLRESQINLMSKQIYPSLTMNNRLLVNRVNSIYSNSLSQ